MCNNLKGTPANIAPKNGPSKYTMIFLQWPEDSAGPMLLAGLNDVGILIATRSLENLMAFRLGTYGDLVVLSATVAWSTTTIAFRKYLTEMNAGVVTFYRFLFASLVFAAYLVFSSEFVSNA
jgi:hypothetical protein